MNSIYEKRTKQEWVKRYLYYTFIISSTIAVFNGFVWYIYTKEVSIVEFVLPLMMSGSVGFSCVLIFSFCGKYIDQINNSIIKFFAVCGLILAASVLANEFSSFFENQFFFHKEYTLFMYLNQLIWTCIISLIIGISIYLREVREVKKAEAAQKITQQEIKIMELNQLKVKAELETLQSKINPHFLYNSLNSIARLVRVDVDKAEQMILNLSKLFRYSINTQGNNYSSVKEEIEMVKTYLDIEKVRFGDKLNFKINVAPRTENYLIPRFLVQPLVENAVKHGTSKLTAEGILSVNIVKNSDQLEINIQDNGPAFPDGMVSLGYGLQSTYEKLNLLFPNAHEVQILNGKEKQIKIILKKLDIEDPNL